MRITITFLVCLFFSHTLSGQYPYMDVSSFVGVDNSVQGVPPDNLSQFGTGLSLVDFTNDGFDDIVIGNGPGLQSLWWINNGDGTFTEIASPINNTNLQKVPLFGDIDNDGDLDLFVAGWTGQNRLYLNEGGLIFQDITSQAGITIPANRSNGSSFCDVNNDGHLDLYVCNRTDDQEGNLLYVNNGDLTFTEAAIERGVSDGSQLSHQSVFFDYDNDGDQDLYIGNDRLARNSLYENDGNGYFTNVTSGSGAGIIIDAMNTGVGDMNNDGFLDIYITNRPNGGGNDLGGSRCLLNNGDGTFTEVAEDVGLNIPYFSWAACWLDFDNDKDEDIFVATMLEMNPFVLHQNNLQEFGLQLFLNPWPEGFENGMQIGYGAAVFDYNNDGKLDIVTPNLAPSPVQVWENATENTNNWLQFTLEGVYSTRDAVGTRIEVYTDGDFQTRYSRMSDSYLSQNHQRLHFGLGDSQVVDTVVVHWLSGVTDVYYAPDFNQTMHLVEGGSHELSLLAEVTSISCSGKADGSIAVSTSNGTPPYSIAWNTGSTDFDLSDLASGRYIATLTDVNGLTGILVQDLLDPEPLVLDLVSQNETGLADGSVDAMVSGGIPDYSYLWSNGSTSPTLTGLSEGVYTVDVTDNNECISTGTAVVYNSNGPCAYGVVTEVETTSYSATLYWGDLPNLNVVRIAYRPVGSDVWDYLLSSGPESALIPDLMSSTTYEYRLRSRCADLSKSDWSEIQEFTTLGEGVSPVCASWVATEILQSQSNIMIYFSLQENSDSYRIRYRVIGTIGWIRFNTMVPSFFLGPYPAGTEFEYQTSTRCNGSWTDWSEVFYFSTLADEGFTLPGEDGISERSPQSTIESEWELFPNPAFDYLTIISIGKGVELLRIFNSNGQEIKVIQPVGSTVEVKLTNWSSGLYWVVSQSGDGTISVLPFIRN